MIQAAHDPRRSRWIPWAFVAFLTTVVVVNGIMVWFALTTFTGVTVPRAYERGRGYDQVLAEAARQDALGWSARVTFAGSTLRVAVTDRAGLPVPGRIDGAMLRPIEGDSVALAFAATGAGHWEAPLPALRAGQWEARLTLFGPDGAAFDIRQRAVMP